jgi:hypothetical protein
MQDPTYQLMPLDGLSADLLRARGGSTYIADSKPGYPCRQCLRDAEIGEALVLVSHDPFTKDSPYRSSSPIFVHAEPCSLDTARSTGLPTQLIVRQLSVRAFDQESMMIDAAVIQGTDLHATLQRMFADKDVEVVHVHNAVRGCWATNVVRAGEATAGVSTLVR